MWVVMLVVLLLAAQLNLTAIFPLQPGSPPPPWWLGGRLLWPFAVETPTLIKGDVLSTLTPILGIASALLFLLASAALLHWLVPSGWFHWLVVAGAVLSIILQVIWLCLGGSPSPRGRRAPVGCHRPAHDRREFARVDDQSRK